MVDLTAWEMVGADGSSWDLSTGDDVRLSGSGVTLPPLGAPGEFRFDTAADIHGQTRRATRYGAMGGSMQVHVNPDLRESVQEEITRRWFAAWSYDDPCTLRAITPNGQRRALDIHASGATDLDEEFADALLLGSQEFRMEFVADRAFAYGEEVTLKAPPPAYNPGFYYGGKGPSFWLADSYFRGQTTVTNPGDFDAWAVWYVQGPVLDYRIALPGGVLQSSYPVPAGALLTLDGRPGEKAAYLTVGNVTTNISDELTSWDFAPIPKGDDVTIELEYTGAGSVTGLFHPLYKRLN